MVSPISSIYEWLANIVLGVVFDLVKLLLPGAIVVGVYLLLQKEKTPGAAAARSKQSGQGKQNQNVDDAAAVRSKQNQNVDDIAAPARTVKTLERTVKTPARNVKAPDRRLRMEDSKISYRQRETDLLLIGKTGNGKSATGNSILWRLGYKPFKSSASSSSVTFEVSFEVTEYKGRRITVVDGPGVGDTREEGIDIVDMGLQNAIALNDDGYHAFLLVVKMGARFTQEDIDTVELLKDYFGGSAFVKNYCILVITGGDFFEAESEDSGKTFEQWCDEQEGVLKRIMLECNNRVVLFDNLTRDETKRCKQLEKLLKLVESLPSKGRYCDEQFEMAKVGREKAIVNQKKPKINKEMLIETSLILQKVKEIQTIAEPNEQLEPLRDQNSRLDALYKKIKFQDKTTGALQDLLEAVENLRRMVYSQTELCQQMIKDGQIRKEDKKKIEAEKNKLNKIQAEYDKLKKRYEGTVATNSQKQSKKCMIL